MANTLPTTELPAIVPNARESHESDRLSPMTKYLPGGTLVRRIGADAYRSVLLVVPTLFAKQPPVHEDLVAGRPDGLARDGDHPRDEVAGFAALRRAAGEVTGTVEDDDVPTVELARQSARLHHQDPVTGSECRDHRRGRDREGLDQRSPKQRCAECGHGEDHDPLYDEPSPPVLEGRVLVRKARLLAAELESFQAIVVTASCGAASGRARCAGLRHRGRCLSPGRLRKWPRARQGLQQVSRRPQGFPDACSWPSPSAERGEEVAHPLDLRLVQVRKGKSQLPARAEVLVPCHSRGHVQADS